ncbi:phage/plasmid primase, P4 family [Gallibacterium salpingitidis]|uniref:DNA primase n=1 Tax=Gallibacterium salpingitidis TaxID=505341 RepID=A0A1A7NYA9_9PAST|nr:phage/plasmid primase, P4 family [Gallibacterium salpingitidis]OBW95197.1 DNA primase [Gallibacterium salpingitidis]
MRLTNAPYVKDQSANPYESTIILAGSEAWQAWSNGNGQGWHFLADTIETDRNQPPVILDKEKFNILNTLRIAPKEKQIIEIFKFGKLSDDDVDKIVLNLAEHTDAKTVSLKNNIGELVQDLSHYVERARKGEAVAKDTVQYDEPKVKEKDGTNIKARAFVKWLGLDLAVQRESGNIYAYNGLIWERVDEQDLTYKAVGFFEENEFSYSARTIENIINTAKIQLPLMKEAKNFISFKNGSLNRDTLEFKPHCREDYLTSIIPYDYLTDKQETPLFDRWLNFVSEEKTEKKYNLLAALYMILTNRYNWQLFLEITGRGGSGKSVFTEIATMLAGRENTESARLQDFDEPRERTPLHGKTLIICPEQSRYGGDGSGLKSITGGDALAIEPKYRNKFKSIIAAIILVVNNEPTRFTERSGGVERRRVPFVFNHVVPEKERDPDFVKKLEQEIGGIIQKILSAFPNPEDAKTALESQKNSDEALEVKKQSDHITAFCEHFTTLPQLEGLFIGNARSNQFTTAKTHLYPAYLLYIDANNISGGLNLNNFSGALRQGLEQNNAPHPMKKRRTKYGVKTNVTFKNFEEFYNEYIKP